MTSDPNGWVTQPPATMVKVVNTSQERLNGKMGVALAFQQDRGRYVVLMTVSQEQVSLKPENLVKGGWTEQLRAQYELMQNNPQVKEQISKTYRQVQAFTGVKPEYVGGAALVVLVACIYWFGFSRSLMVISFFMMMGLVVLPDLQNGASRDQILRNAPMRFKAMVRQNVPYVGDRIANSNILTGLVLGVMIFFLVNALVGGTGSGGARPPPPVSPVVGGMGGTTVPYNMANVKPAPAVDRAMLEDYYKMGFEDAQAGKDFGTSLPPPPVHVETPKGADGVDSDFAWPGSDYVPPAQTKPSLLSKFTSWSTLVSLFLVGNTLYTCGRTAEGGFDPQLMMVNVRMLDVWKQGMLAMSVFRLVSPFLSSSS